ncbi:MAG: hypothetical protein SGARI_002892 [Bacillariaceae sp.]
MDKAKKDGHVFELFREAMATGELVLNPEEQTHLISNPDSMTEFLSKKANENETKEERRKRLNREKKRKQRENEDFRQREREQENTRRNRKQIDGHRYEVNDASAALIAEALDKKETRKLEALERMANKRMESANQAAARAEEARERKAAREEEARERTAALEAQRLAREMQSFERITDRSDTTFENVASQILSPERVSNSKCPPSLSSGKKRGHDGEAAPACKKQKQSTPRRHGAYCPARVRDMPLNGGSVHWIDENGKKFTHKMLLDHKQRFVERATKAEEALEMAESKHQDEIRGLKTKHALEMIEKDMQLEAAKKRQRSVLQRKGRSSLEGSSQERRQSGASLDNEMEGDVHTDKEDVEEEVHEEADDDSYVDPF